jgi:hypothetical protein
LVAGFVGCIAPLSMGLCTALLVRPKDHWEDLSAGITTALAGTVTSFAAGIGWAVVIAMVVVPSLADLTLACHSIRTPAPSQTEKTAVERIGHPSDALVKAYPDLQEIPANDRGALLFPKIIADLAVGSFSGAWLGISFALGTCGLLGLCGTLVGGRLLRCGDRWHAVILPYLEVTIPVTIAVSLLLGRLAPILGPISFQHLAFPWLVWVTAVIIVAARRHSSWVLRLTLVATWVVFFLHNLGTALPWYLAAVVYACAAVLLLWQYVVRRPQPVMAVG